MNLRSIPLPSRTARTGPRAAPALLTTLLLAAAVLTSTAATATPAPEPASDAGDRVAATAVLDRSAVASHVEGPAEPQEWVLSSAGHVHSDSSTPGGTQARMWAEGTATTTVSGQGQVVVHARADQCQGSPKMHVAVDGRTAGWVEVANHTSEPWAAYRLGDFDIPEGEHQVTVSFRNDHRTSECDRNLNLGGVSFYAAPPAWVQRWSIDGNGVFLADGTSPGKGQAHLWSNGTTSTTVSGSGTLTVYARSEPCYGYHPRAQVLVDGRPVGSFTPENEYGWSAHQVGAPLVAGEHQVTVRYLNDMTSTQCDRNLRLGGAALSDAG